MRFVGVACALGLLCAPAVRADDTTGPVIPPEAPPDTPPPPEPPPEPTAKKPWEAGVSPDAQARARDLFQQGNASFLEDMPSAIRLYREALASWDHPNIRFNLARCLISVGGDPLEIYEHLRRATQFGQEPYLPDTPTLFDEAKNYLKLVREQLGEVTIVCGQPGARVSIDGAEKLVCPGKHSQMMRAGSHQLVASKAGFETLTRRLEVKPGSSPKFKVELELVKDKVYEPPVPAWIPYTVAGTGLALIALAIPLQAAASGNFDDFDEIVATECARGCLPNELSEEARATRDRARLQNRLAITGFALGGTTLVGGLTWVLLNRPRPVEGAPPVTITATPDQVSATATFEF